MAKYDNIKIVNAWQKYTNPLRYLNSSQIEQMLEQMRFGNDIRLQVAFEQMEKLTPIFNICIQKRISGILQRNWDIVPLNSSPKAIRQAEKVKRIFEKADTLNIDGLTNAIEHLALGAFRGRSAVKPFIHGNDLIFKNLDNWNVLFYNSKLYWNPSSDFAVLNDASRLDLQELTQDEICFVLYDRPVDLPGISIYLRQLVGEDKYAQAIERFNVAPIVITAPEGTTDVQLNVFQQRAYELFQGGSGVLPNGCNVTSMNNQSDYNAFNDFVTHQSEMICLIAIGGSLTTIGGSTGLGSNVAEKQSDDFQMIINGDCKKIANAISHTVVPKVVNEILNENEILCRFSYVDKDIVSPKEYLEMFTALRNANVDIDINEFKKVSGISFIKDVDEWQPADVDLSKADLSKAEWSPEDKESLKEDFTKNSTR